MFVWLTVWTIHKVLFNLVLEKSKSVIHSNLLNMVRALKYYPSAEKKTFTKVWEWSIESVKQIEVNLWRVSWSFTLHTPPPRGQMAALMFWKGQGRRGDSVWLTDSCEFLGRFLENSRQSKFLESNLEWSWTGYFHFISQVREKGEYKEIQHWKWKCYSLSRVRLFVTPWAVARQAPLSMGFSRQEHWSGLPFPSPEDLPDPVIEPRSPTLQQILHLLSHQGSQGSMRYIRILFEAWTISLDLA